MKIRPCSLLIVLIIMTVAVPHLGAQQVAPGQWLLRLLPTSERFSLLDRLEAHLLSSENQNGQSRQGHTTRPRLDKVSDAMNIWLLTVENSQQDLLPWLLKQPEVVMAQDNHYLTMRNNLLPNDPLFTQQWQYINDGLSGGKPNADLDAELAWSITTGGLSMAGDTIVVAVIDGGVNKTHPDLVENLWHNWAEIPHDGIDNDGNGYIDDFNGWNVFTHNDYIQGVSTAHGTPISGIIGASGDNGVGVTGVNWKVKIMFVAGGNLESELLSAFDYVLKARKKYNQSSGTAGAFVVAVNCSWGIDYGMPVNAPLWCAAFDELGEAGIVSVAATANNPVNVDIVGDLPTTCPSDYLISVTSLDRNDEKAPDAAWGQTNIDLGAYGAGIYTTGAGGQYGTFSGTSFAAPHVAGSIGLLYAAPCPELIAVAKINPKAAAIWAKSIVLESTTPNSSLENHTVSNGRLNLNNLLQQYQAQCATCPAPFGLKTTTISPYAVLLKWSVINGVQSVSLRWRKSGTVNWTILENITGEYLLEGLAPCTNYEFSLQCKCQNAETSTWSTIFSFTTSGCCQAPNFTWSATPENNGVVINWSILQDYALYKIIIHKKDASTWQTFISGEGTFLIPNLEECTLFEIQIQGWCLDSWINLTPLTPYLSSGCGACLEKQYCTAGASTATQEWITSVQVGNWIHQSGWGGGGYQDLTAEQGSNPSIAAQTAVDFVVTPGFWGTPYKEFFRVYIDYNLDGDFDDPGELAFDPGFAQSGVAIGSLVAPAFTQTGTTRMRVMMKYAEDNQLPPGPCSAFSYGQVEDYCIDLVDTPTNAKISYDSTLILNIYPQPATNYAWMDVKGSKAFQFDLKIWDIAGRTRYDQTVTRLRNGAIFIDTTDWPAGIFFVLAKADGKTYRGKLIKQ